MSKIWEIEYWSVDDQRKWLNEKYYDIPYETIRLVIPENTPRRRNFGFLRAIELGVEYMIAIDDDNLPMEADWLRGHLDAFDLPVMNYVSSKNTFVNPCAGLSLNHRRVYLRGYPISEMLRDSFVFGGGRGKPVIANMGLWKNKPDVDAYTNIKYPDLKSDGIDKNIMWNNEKLAITKDNYFPLNTQNTIMHKDALVVWFQPHMDKELGIDRHDDIWSGYIIEKIAHHLGHTLTFGTPLSNHDRNTHSYEKDLSYELFGDALNPHIIEKIRKTKLRKDSYLDCYAEIVDSLENITSNDPDIREYLNTLTFSMRTWIRMVKRLL